MSTSDNNTKQLVAIQAAELLEARDDIIKKNIPIWRINKAKQKVVVPLNKLDDYLGNESLSIQFYIQKNWKEVEIGDEDFIKEVEQEEKQESVHAEKIKVFHKMTFVEREEVLDNSIETIHEMVNSNKGLDLKSIMNMVEVIVNTLYINNAVLEENEAIPMPQANINGVIVKTKWVIDYLIQLLHGDSVNFADFKQVDEISTGSITIDQANKTFIRFMGFCIFYNDFIESGMISAKVRRDFKNKHYRYYKRKLPDLTRITLESVFDGGIRRLSDDEIKQYSLGALLHDIGKLPDIDYHDSTGEFDVKRVKLHVLIGYNMLINAKAFPFEIIAMTAFHHEYYGDKSGYNFTKPIMMRHKKRLGSEHNIKCFISYSADDFLKDFGLANFSCKVLEIIDVFTALYDKKGHKSVDALKIMKKEFIIQSLKIDPVIFDIFMYFLKECRIVSEDEIAEVDVII